MFIANQAPANPAKQLQPELLESLRRQKIWRAIALVLDHPKLADGTRVYQMQQRQPNLNSEALLVQSMPMSHRLLCSTAVLGVVCSRYADGVKLKNFRGGSGEALSLGLVESSWLAEMNRLARC